MMPSGLSTYLEEDHKRLEQLLYRATSGSGGFDHEPYAEFRRGLLRHISIEEKVLFPAVVRMPEGIPGDLAERLRLEHGALVALLVPPPNAGIIATIRSILDRHNALEEAQGGVYALSQRLTENEGLLLLERMRLIPQVPVLPHNPRPEVLLATRRAVERAGYVLWGL
jgi:hypothetical protein